MPRRRDNPEEEEVESRDSQNLLQHVPGDGEDIGPNSVTPLNTMNVPEFKDIRRLVEEVGKNQERVAILRCFQQCDVTQNTKWNGDLRSKLDIEISRSSHQATSDFSERRVWFDDYKRKSREPDRDLIQETDHKIKGLDGEIGDTISAIDSPTIFKDHIFEDKQIKEKQLIRKLAEFKLEVSVRALLKKLCSANKQDLVTDAQATQLFELLGEEMLRKSFKSPDQGSNESQDGGPFFGQVLSNEWQEAASLVLESMIVEEKETDGSVELFVDFQVLEEEKMPKERRWPTHTVYQNLATRSNDLVNHDLCRLFTNQKWKKYWKWCCISGLSYLFTTFCLTYTLVTSVMADNVQEYSSSLDYSRAVFEVMSVICVFLCLLLEVHQIVWGRCLYFTDRGNWFELGSTFVLCLTVLLRFSAERHHWYFFAVGYFLWISQTYKQSILIKSLYLRAEIFIQVIIKDVFWFVLLFLVVNVAFMGASFLTLRGDNNLRVDNQTSSYPELFFMGVRTLAEGQPVLEYAGNGEYSPVSTMVFVLFMFVTCVILLNLLIAQLGQTLENVSEELDNNYNAKLAHMLAWMEINTTHFCCSKLKQLTLRLSKKDYSQQLYQPVNASDKILSKTKRMKESHDSIEQNLTVTSAALHEAKQLNETIETELAAIEKTLDQNTQAFQSFPSDVKKTLDNLKKKLEEGLKGHFTRESTGQCLSLQEKKQKQKDQADAKIPPREQVSTVKNIPPVPQGDDQVDTSTIMPRMQGDWQKKLQERPQEEVLCFMENCGIHGYNPAHWKISVGSKKIFPLVVAVEKGFYQVVSKLLDLLRREDGAHSHFSEKLAALKAALSNEYDQTAALIVKDMQREHRKQLIKLFIAQNDENKTEAKVRLNKKYYDDKFLNFWLALLDTVCSEEDLKLFEVGEDGKTPGKREKSVFDLLADWAHWEIFSHPVVQSLVEKKWVYDSRRCQFIFECVIYVFTLVCLTTLVVTSGMAEDVTAKSYSSFQARHLFEVLSMILLLFSAGKEFAELKREGRRFYFKDHFNKAELFSSILLLIAVPLRFVPSQCHWYLFAVGYFVWVMIVFKYAILSREFGTYAQSLWTILWTDVVFFLTLFAVVDVAFSGALYLILRGDNYLTLHTETSTWWGTLFVGLRVLTDGQNGLGYYGFGEDEGFKSFQSVATVVVFLFVVIVLLANILIAQLSNTYTNIQEKSRGATWARKAHTISRLQRATWLNALVALCRCKDPQDTETIEDFNSCLTPSETNINIRIDKNVTSLGKKLPAIESNVVGLKALAEQCQKGLMKAEQRIKQGLDDSLVDRIIKMAESLKAVEANIEDRCKAIEMILRIIIKETQIRSHLACSAEHGLVLKDLTSCTKLSMKTSLEHESVLKEFYKHGARPPSKRRISF